MSGIEAGVEDEEGSPMVDVEVIGGAEKTSGRARVEEIDDSCRSRVQGEGGRKR